MIAEIREVPEPWTEEVIRIRPGATLIQWTNPRTTQVIGALYGPTEECKSADEARALLVEDASLGARREEVQAGDERLPAPALPSGKF